MQGLIGSRQGRNKCNWIMSTRKLMSWLIKWFLNSRLFHVNFFLSMKPPFHFLHASWVVFSSPVLISRDGVWEASLVHFAKGRLCLTPSWTVWKRSLRFLRNHGSSLCWQISHPTKSKSEVTLRSSQEEEEQLQLTYNPALASSQANPYCNPDYPWGQ